MTVTVTELELSGATASLARSPNHLTCAMAISTASEGDTNDLLRG